MANKLYEEESIQAIADSIRRNAPNTTSGATFSVDEMAQAVDAVYAEGYEDGLAEGGNDSVVDYTTTWEIARVPDLTGLPKFTSNKINISFTSNGDSFKGILLGGATTLCYYSFYAMVVYDSSSGWSNDAYRTITIHEQITDIRLYVWLMSNATLISGEAEVPFQYAYDERLITEEKTVVGAINEIVNNGVGGGSSLEMPLIRFVGLRGDNYLSNLDGEEYPVQFTVEVIAGSVQVGDTLQICGMRTFWASPQNLTKKRKLRRFAEYVITEEDLDKRFLTLTVYPTRNAFAHLSHNNRQSGGPCDYYFRIRRPLGDLQANDSGMTVDAKFSNIVPVSMLNVVGATNEDTGEKEVKINVI